MDNGSNFMKNISPDEIKSIMQSELGQQLIRVLNKKDGSVLRSAAQAAQKGHYDKAFEALEPLLKDTDASTLARKLKDRYG